MMARHERGPSRAPRMSHAFARRLDRAAQPARTVTLSALVVTPSPDLFYLTGYDAPVLERRTALVVRAKGGPVVVVPRLEQPRARASSAGKLVEVVSWMDGEDPYRLVRKLVKAKGRL